VTIGEETVLAPGSPAVWFTFPGEWHDIGRFHRPDGAFTGFYANVLTPVRVEGDAWHTTDLFLDVFLAPGGRLALLDADELDGAERTGAVAPADARRARVEADRLLRAAAAGTWPPPIVHAWPLDRARAVAAGTPG
jgi:predicted RNA-binding protein associated with RNAse of E/G family